MIYRIVYLGADLWSLPEKKIFSPTLEIELNTAGELSFTLAPDHPDFFNILPMKGTMEVYEKNELIWFGRPVSLERDIFNNKPVYCEGALAYFNDSAQRPRSNENKTTAAALFADILSAHNAQVPADRQFLAGAVDMPSDEFAWENDYSDSLSVVKDMLQKRGGYLIPRRSGSVNTLDYLYDLPMDAGQPVRFAENLREFKREYTFVDKFTAVLPVGGVPDGQTEALTIASVNGGSDILDGSGVSEFGRLIKVIKYPNITDASELRETAQKVLDNVRFDPVNIEVSAVDLSQIDNRYTPFRVGNQYHVVSPRHDVDVWLPLVGMDIPLDQAARQIKLGTASNPGITDLYESTDQQINYVKQSIAPKTGGQEWNSPAGIKDEGGGSEAYTVTFMNGDTVLEIVEHVRYGSNVDYPGEMPAPLSEGFVFSGWNPLPENITEDLVCYAQFVNTEVWDWGVFVDDNNHFYDVYESKLRIRDGLTGEVIAHEEPARSILVGDGVRFAAVNMRTDSDVNWRIIYKDGTSCDIVTPTRPGVWGFRNGILAYAYNKSSGGYIVYTYTKDGTFLNKVFEGSTGMYSNAYHLFPISATRVGVSAYYAVGPFTQMPAESYNEVGIGVGENGVIDHGFLWQDYYSASANKTNYFNFLGLTDDYFYGWGQLHAQEDSGTILPTRVIAKFSIENFDGAIELERYEEARAYTEANSYGNLRRRRPVEETYIYELYNPINGSIAFGGEIGAATATAYDFYENRNYVWYGAIYQKSKASPATPQLMLSPSSLSLSASDQSGNVAITTNSDGAILVTSSDTGIASASVSGNVLHVTSTGTAGQAVITVKTAATAKYVSACATVIVNFES